MNLTVQQIYYCCWTLDKISLLFVAVDTVLYNVKSTFETIDTCFKIFHALNTTYPAASEHIWLLIQLVPPVRWIHDACDKDNQYHWLPITTFQGVGLPKRQRTVAVSFLKMATIEFIVDPRTPTSKNVLAILRKFLAKDLANKFTFLKVTKDKFTLKPSMFYNCIIDVFKAKCQNKDLQENVSQKELDKIIGVVLTNSKDWNKGRLQKINNITETKNVQENNNDDDEDTDNN